MNCFFCFVFCSPGDKCRLVVALNELPLGVGELLATLQDDIRDHGSSPAKFERDPNRAGD
jgi:hypothetical protein